MSEMDPERRDALLARCEDQLRALDDTLSQLVGGHQSRSAEMAHVRARLGCIARVSAAHDGHACPADDCMSCWPRELIKEFAGFSRGGA